MRRLVKITVKQIDDGCPDLSYLGEYSERPQAGAIDREAIGERGRNECRYFNPAYPERAQQDYDRMEAYHRGEWHCVGIRAEAEIQTSGDGRNWLCNRISSGGLWGLESDADDDYFDVVVEEELVTLRNALAELGFGAEELDRAFRSTERLKRP